MPALPELRPTGTAITVSGTFNASGEHNVARLADELDNSLVRPTVNATEGSLAFPFTDTPSDFLSMDSFSINLRARLSSTGDDNFSIRSYLVASDGTTALSTIPSTQRVTSTTLADFTFSVSLTTTNDKTAWDGAYLRIDWIHSASMSSDSSQTEVARAGITGTYTATSGGITDRPKHRASGTFTARPAKVKIDGTFTEKQMKIKVGGSWVSV